MKFKFIDNLKDWHKFSSVRLAAFAALVAGIITANQGLALGMIGLLPNGPLRIVVAVIVMAVVFVIPALARVTEKTNGPV